MYLSYPAFESAMSQSSLIFSTWDDSIKEFTNVAREVTRKRSEKFLPIKIESKEFFKLQERINYLRGWRKAHFQLVVMVGPLSNEGKKLIAGVGEGSERGSSITDIDMDAEVCFVSILLISFPS